MADCVETTIDRDETAPSGTISIGGAVARHADAVGGPIIPSFSIGGGGGAADEEQQPEEPEDDNEPKYEVGEFPVEILNGQPVYQQGHLLHSVCHVFERIGYDDRVGATYLALADGAEERELVLRVDHVDGAVVKIEGAFLTKAEAAGHVFLFSQVHSCWERDGRVHLTLFYRGGPTLPQILSFLPDHRLSHGSAARFGLDIWKILRATHSLGYLMRSLTPDQFHFCAMTRHLFAADISTLRLDTLKAGMDASLTPWVGGPLYAPLCFHDQETMTTRDELEAFVYMLLDLHLGELPWTNVYNDGDAVKFAKLDAVDGPLWEGLPKQYKELYDLIGTLERGVAISDETYDKGEQLLTAIFTEAGITDHEMNFDFEREPTEEELPKFVLEKKPKEETAEAEPTN